MYPDTQQKLFQIQPYCGHYYYPGHLPRGRQALIGQCIYGTITAAIFDAAGYLQKVIKRSLPSKLLTPTDVVGYEVDEQGFQEYLRREFYFQPGVIRVREFRIPDEHFGVYQMPEHFEAFLKDPNDPWFTDTDRREYPTLIHDWIASGSFFLEWGNSYWLDKDGKYRGS